jgi:hypothetical protein
MKESERWMCALAPGEHLLWSGRPDRRGDTTVYQITDRRLIITAGRSPRSSTSYYLDQLPTARLVEGRGHGHEHGHGRGSATAVGFDADLVRPERPLFARFRPPVELGDLTGQGVQGDTLGVLRLPPAPKRLVGLPDASEALRILRQAQADFPTLHRMPSYAPAKQPTRAEAGPWAGHPGDEVLWIASAHRSRTTYLVTRSRMIVLGRGRPLTMRLDRALPPAVDDHGTVWLTSADPRVSVVFSSPWIGTIHQRRRATRLRFEAVADPQKVHDVIVAAQMASTKRH